MHTTSRWPSQITSRVPSRICQLVFSFLSQEFRLPLLFRRIRIEISVGALPLRTSSATSHLVVFHRFVECNDDNGVREINVEFRLARLAVATERKLGLSWGKLRWRPFESGAITTRAAFVASRFNGSTRFTITPICSGANRAAARPLYRERPIATSKSVCNNR